MVGGSLQTAAREGGLLKSFAAIYRQEGLMGYWRGNLPQVCSAGSRLVFFPACLGASFTANTISTCMRSCAHASRNQGKGGGGSQRDVQA